MPKTPRSGAVRQAVAALLALSLWIGPGMLGGSLASAAALLGASGCPCAHAEGDDASLSIPQARDAGDCAEILSDVDLRTSNSAVVSGSEAPCDDCCPKDCRNCNCCRGVTLAVIFPATAPSSPLAISLTAVDLWGTPTSSARLGIFRPPR